MWDFKTIPEERYKRLSDFDKSLLRHGIIKILEPGEVLPWNIGYRDPFSSGSVEVYGQLSFFD